MWTRREEHVRIRKQVVFCSFCLSPWGNGVSLYYVCTKSTAQRVTATYQMDRRPHQDCGESLDADGFEPVTL